MSGFGYQVLDAGWRCRYLSPVECMHAGVNHQSAGPEDLLAEVAKPGHTVRLIASEGRLKSVPVQRVVIQPQVKAQALAVEPPALAVSSVDGEAGGRLAVDSVLLHLAEEGPSLLLQCIRVLQVVAWV